MKLDITKLSYEAKWFDFETGKALAVPDPERACLKIRPYPMSRAKVTMRQGGLVIDGEDRCEMFVYSLVDWKNVIGADDKPLPCSDDVKQKVFDFRMGGIPEFVAAKAWDFQVRKEEEEKNS